MLSGPVSSVVFATNPSLAMLMLRLRSHWRACFGARREFNWRSTYGRHILGQGPSRSRQPWGPNSVFDSAVEASGRKLSGVLPSSFVIPGVPMQIQEPLHAPLRKTMLRTACGNFLVSVCSLAMFGYAIGFGARHFPRAHPCAPIALPGGGLDQADLPSATC